MNSRALSEDDVVSVTSGQILMPHSTFKVDEFMKKMTQTLPGDNELKHKWLSNSLAGVRIVNASTTPKIR